MKLTLKEDKLHVRTFLSPCDCSCRFCCLHKVHKKPISFDDYEVVLRKYSKNIDAFGMRLRSFIYNRPDVHYIDAQMKLYKELKMIPEEYTRLDMNGIPIMNDLQLKEWFNLMKKAGITFSMYSWFGLEDSHDEFVRREGYYQFQQRCISASKNSGIGVKNKIFLRKSILHEVEALAKILERESNFLQCVFMEYAGNAISLEDEFLTSEDVASLSPYVRNLIEKPYFSKYKTEKEWVSLACSDQFPTFRIVDYILILDRENIDYYKKTELTEVIESFREMDIRMQEEIGEIADLASTYGDKEGLILYECRDVLRKWINKSLQKKGVKYDDLFGPDKTCVEWKVFEKMH